MPITYYQSATEVMIGDHVRFKVGLFFWRGWQAGRVVYVPGQSPKNPQLEFNGLRWICVRGATMDVGAVIDPVTDQVRKTVRFVKRTDDDLTETPNDFVFEPDN